MFDALTSKISAPVLKDVGLLDAMETTVFGDELLMESAHGENIMRLIVSRSKMLYAFRKCMVEHLEFIWASRKQLTKFANSSIEFVFVTKRRNG